MNDMSLKVKVRKEVFKKYNDLEQHTVEDLFTKYLPVNEKGNKPET